eukprot:2933943-Pyramimonas_sp.AAC.1
MARLAEVPTQDADSVQGPGVQSAVADAPTRIWRATVEASQAARAREAAAAHCRRATRRLEHDDDLDVSRQSAGAPAAARLARSASGGAAREASEP